MELSIQLAIIFMGKQFVQSIFEYYIPLLWRFINWVKLGLWNFYVIQFVVYLSTFSCFPPGQRFSGESSAVREGLPAGRVESSSSVLRIPGDGHTGSGGYQGRLKK